ncbi:MAG TPA: TRAP transporter substrate-binding protein [Syntrophorhabdaceae bacterium]|nr:TRAP transporter substrate-binding protein [Syntrophorhabdaceae bacterium]HON86245.1 TRAP transporter substrate-binding protein [Syntrophorhabdaceae bacterium]HOT42665.1 TRAP transporter substrate-binding protein [Syntrophorhabdaceae bacterium]HQE80980.1 TRAP transporter substrate-binding protein [Syntrophorhabdaceae bacterium]HQH43999.1 TRAP transporter substrate-binding protein [Syntrophorhabdaceae bacterium]
MKKRSMMNLVTLATVFIVLLSATSLFADTMKLRFALLWPPQHPHTKLLTQWGKDIEKATNGRIIVTAFPSNTLSPPMQVFDNTVKGIVDIASTLLAYAPGRLPLSEVLQLPLGYRDGYQATKLANAYYKKFKPKEFDDVKVMFLHGAAPGFVFTKKPIKSIEEVKGLRIRANAENIGIVKAIGAAPVTMPVSEAYDALSRGLVDGTLFPIEPLQGFKLAEVVKAVLENYGISYMTSFYVIMNKDKWNKISPEDQKAIEKLNEEYADKIGKQWVELDNKAKDFAKSKGVTFVSVSKEEEEATAKKMKPVLDEYLKMTKSKGLPGEQALKFCQDYLKQYK